MTIPPDLADRGYDLAFFASASPRLRRTVLNHYARLRPLGLWEHVHRESGSKDGCLHFLCRDVDRLRGALVASGFTAPERDGGYWHSRERRALCALHVKHFVHWPRDRVQVHIDLFGAAFPRLYWLFPPVPIGLALLHALSPRSYLLQALIHRVLRWQARRDTL